MKALKAILRSLLLLCALPALATVQSYFNYNDNNSYTDPYRGVFRQGDNLEEVIIEGIARATQTIDVAVHEFRLPLVAKALVDKVHSGVRVRVILENQYNFALRDYDWDHIPDDYSKHRMEDYFKMVDIDHDGKLSEMEFQERDAIYMLRLAGIPIIDDTEDGTKGSGLMHDKFMIIDNRDVLTGSTNYTMSDTHGDMGDFNTRGNANNMVGFWDEPAVAQVFSEEFGYMWGDGPGGRKDSLFGVKKPYREAKRLALSNGDFLNIQFSPTGKRQGYDHSSAGLIDRTLKLAKKSVDMAHFVFSDQNLSNSLGELYNFSPEMQVRTLVEKTFAYQWYSEMLDMLGVEMLSERCKVEENNEPWARPIYDAGTPGLAAGDMLHHKFGVVDSYYTIFGSHNWSKAANEHNDEAVMVVESFDVAKAFTAEFERQHKGGSFGVPAWVKAKIEKQKAKCAGQVLPSFLGVDGDGEDLEFDLSPDLLD